MGLFDFLKKKKEELPVNLPNSIHTLRFTIPYFQIFDKTDTQLSTLPIKMAVSGSCQYRIIEPELCIDNVALINMLPQQLETHVKDALSMNIKSFFNSITSIPVLQFESMIAMVSDAAKDTITTIMREEFGINLRTFNISNVRYDEEDPNYLRLQEISRKVAEGRAKKVDVQTESEIEQIKLDSKISAKHKEADADIQIAKRKHDMELEKKKREFELNTNMESKKQNIDLDKKMRMAEIESKRKEAEINEKLSSVADAINKSLNKK